MYCMTVGVFSSTLFLMQAVFDVCLACFCFVFIVADPAGREFLKQGSSPYN